MIDCTGNVIWDRATSVRERLRSAPTTPLILVCLFCGWPHREGRPIKVSLGDLAHHFARAHGQVLAA